MNFLQDKLASLAAKAHRLYGASLMMEGSDLIADEELEEKNSKEEQDFFTQDFVAHQSNSSSSISQDAFINSSANEPALGQSALYFQMLTFCWGTHLMVTFSGRGGWRRWALL